ncbi:MAG: NUDIX domain-containing protein [Oscillospiraceae bacterium]|nr:NUDIX domain-containing protein [Oscillospiraceae bacterium]
MKLRNMTSVYLTGEKGILCLYRIGSRVANNKYIGSAGGHFEPDELNDPRKCVLREMQEELGLTENDVEGLTLRYVTLRRMAGEIRQNYYFFARLKRERQLQSTEGRLEWVPFADIPQLEMPVTARHMILHYLREGRFTDTLYGGITQECGTTFLPLQEFV